MLTSVPAVAQDWAELRDKLFDTADDSFDDQGFRPSGFVHEGSLEDGDGERVTVRIGSGANLILVGICDADCSDLGLTLYDPDGDLVDSDVLTDDIPMITIEGGRSGSYTVAVQMAECTIDPCRYAIQTYTR